MARKSRRLPGGKVRRPEGRRLSPPPPRPVAPAAGGTAAGWDSTADAPERSEVAGDAVVAIPRPARPAPPTAADVRARTAALRQRAAPSQRSGRSLMDLVATNYTHIRGDLARIASLAIVLLAVIVVLSFVIK